MHEQVTNNIQINIKVEHIFKRNAVNITNNIPSYLPVAIIYSLFADTSIFVEAVGISNS